MQRSMRPIEPRFAIIIALQMASCTRLMKQQAQVQLTRSLDSFYIGRASRIGARTTQIAKANSSENTVLPSVYIVFPSVGPAHHAPWYCSIRSMCAWRFIKRAVWYFEVFAAECRSTQRYLRCNECVMIYFSVEQCMHPGTFDI